MSTMKRIAACLADSRALDALRVEVTTRTDVRWTPELFDRKVAEVKHTAKLQASPRVPSPKPKQPKPGAWQVTRTQFPATRVVSVLVNGPLFQGKHPLSLLGTQESVRTLKSGTVQRAEGVFGTLCKNPVRLTLDQGVKLRDRKVILVWLAGRMHDIALA